MRSNINDEEATVMSGADPRAHSWGCAIQEGEGECNCEGITAKPKIHSYFCNDKASDDCDCRGMETTATEEGDWEKGFEKLVYSFSRLNFTEYKENLKSFIKSLLITQRETYIKGIEAERLTAPYYGKVDYPEAYNNGIETAIEILRKAK